MLPRGVRLNNPGNIIQSGIAWQGKETPSRDPRFESFDTPLNGIRALCKLLISYEDKHGLKTVRGIINRWAPPVENNTSAYVTAVAKAVGVGPDDVISTHGAKTLALLATAIIQHENGQQPYPPELIAHAVRLAGGMPDTVGVSKPVANTSAKTAPNVQHIGQQPKESPVGATLLAGLIPSILSLFSGRAQAAISKATGASPEVVQKFTTDLAQQIESVSGVTVTDTATAMKAASIVANDPAKVAELEQRATNFVLAEMGGGLRGAQEEYAAINRDYDDDPAWRIAAKFLFNPVHWVTGVFLFYVQQFIPPLADKVKALDGAAAMGLIVIVFGVIAVVGVRWLGSYAKQQQD